MGTSTSPNYSNDFSVPLFKEIKYKIPKLSNKRPHENNTLPTLSKTEVKKTPLKVNRSQRKDIEHKRFETEPQLFTPDNEIVKHKNADSSKTEKKSSKENVTCVGENRNYNDVKVSNQAKTEKTKIIHLQPREKNDNCVKNDKKVNLKEATDKKDEFQDTQRELTSQAKEETNRINNSTNDIETFDIEDNLRSNFEKPKSHEVHMLNDVDNINELGDQKNCTKSSKENKKQVALNVSNSVEISNGTTEKRKNDINANNQSTNNKVTYEDNDIIE